MSTEDNLRKIINTPITIKQVAIGQYIINYAVAGSGPPLLLIHGANFGWGVWYPNITELAKYFTIYALDLPGAGRSTRIDYATLNPERNFLKVTEEFIRLLKIENFHVIGFSMGAWLALQLDLRHPEWINKIIVESAVGFADYSGVADKIIAFYPFAKIISKIFINSKKRTDVEKFLRGIFYKKSLNLPSEFIDYFWETMQTSHNLLFISRLTSLHRELNLEKQLPKIQHKTLIIWGQEDKIIPLNKNFKNFMLIPGTQVHIIKDAGHVPSLEKPEEFNSTVKNFLLQKV